MTDWEPFHINVARPGIFKVFDAIGSKDEIQIKRSVLKLHKVFSPLNLPLLTRCQCEAQFDKGTHKRLAILLRTLDKQICILSCIREAKKYRTGLADEKVPN